MKTLLTQRRASMLSKPKPEINNVQLHDIEGCQEYITPGEDMSFTDVQLKANEVLCFNLYNAYTLFAYGTALTMEGVDKDGKKVGPVQNAIGGSALSQIKLTATQDTKVSYALLNIELVDDGEQQGFKFSYKQALVTKKEFDVKLTYEASMDDKYSYEEYIYVLNPSGAEATVSPGTDVSAGLVTVEDGNQETILSEQTFKGNYIDIRPYYDENKFDPTSGKGVFKLKTNVVSQSIPEGYPEKVIQLINKHIYSLDDPDFTDFKESGGLSGGAIAAIVIVVILVVGAAAFAVVWFFVLKKGCPCAKNTDMKRIP